jgi:hypothetical protein
VSVGVQITTASISALAQGCVDAADRTAILICNRLCGGGQGIGHRHQFRIAVSGDRLGVDLADAPAPRSPNLIVMLSSSLGRRPLSVCGLVPVAA